VFGHEGWLVTSVIGVARDTGAKVVDLPGISNENYRAIALRGEERPSS
jgi:hypothetical protein